MARLILLMALCVLPAVVMAARLPKANKDTLVVRGSVYCDPCGAGFETSASSFIPDATVKLVCKDRKSMEEVYSAEAKTGKDGWYEIPVHEDHKDEFCDVMLVKSSRPDCAKASPGREQSRVILNHYNGIASPTRYANNMGFEKEQPDVFCGELLKQYQEFDEEN